MSDLTGHLYAWVEVEPDGREGVIAAGTSILPGMMHLLQHRRREIAEAFRPVAHAHGKATGRVVRLVEFVRSRTLEELK